MHVAYERTAVNIIHKYLHRNICITDSCLIVQEQEQPCDYLDDKEKQYQSARVISPGHFMNRDLLFFDKPIEIELFGRKSSANKAQH